MLLLLLLKICELDGRRIRDAYDLLIIVIISVVVAVADEMSAKNSMRDA